MDELEQRLFDHWKKNNQTHIRRAKKAGRFASLPFEDLLCVMRVFGFLCPFCDQNLADTPVWHYNHWRGGVTNSGTSLIDVVISCPGCNIKLYTQHRDDAEAFLIALGKNPNDFFDKIREASHQRQKELEEELAKIRAEGSLMDNAMLNLAQMLEQAAIELKNG